MTHHLPSYQLIDPKYKIFKEINCYFATNLDYLFGPHIKYWLYGHTHQPNQTIINNIKLLVNPLGYKHESFNRLKHKNIFKIIKFIKKYQPYDD